MTDRFGTDSTRTDRTGLDACLDLAAFRPTLFADVASLVWDRAEHRIVTANPVSVRVFRAVSIAAFASGAPDLRQPGFQHLTRIGETFAIDQPRVERLRFFIGFRPVMMSALCQVAEETPDLVVVTALETLAGTRLDPAEKAALIAAELDGAAAIVDAHGQVLATTETAPTDRALTSALADPDGVGAHGSLDTDTFDGPAGVFSIMRRGTESAVETADASDIGVAAATVEDGAPPASSSAMASPTGTDGPDGAARIGTRFRVILDRAGRVGDSWPALGTIGLGQPQAETTLVGFLQETDADAAHALGRALAARDTFSGQAVQWPLSGDAGHADIALAGLPQIDGDAGFDGFRCFGVIEGLTAEEPAGLGDLDTAAVTAALAEPHDAPEHDSESADADAAEPAEAVQSADVADTAESRLAPREQRAFAAIAAALGAHTDTEPAAEAVAETRESADVETAETETVSVKTDSVETDAAETAASGEDAPDADDDPASGTIDGLESAEELADPAEDERDEPARDDAAADDALRTDQPAQRSVSGPADERAETLEEMWREATGNDAGMPAAARLGGETPSEPSLTLVDTPARAAAPSFTEMMDRLPVGLMFMRDDRPLYANRAFLDLFGYPDLDDLEIAGGLSALFENFAAIGGETGLKRVLAGVTRDGDPIDVEARLQIARWIDGPALLLMARERAKADLSQLLEAKTALFELENVLNTATDGVVVLDPSGTVEKLNSSAEALFGYDSEEMKDRPFTDLLAEESRSEAETYLEGVSGSGMESLLNDGREVTGRVKQGGEIPLFLTLGVIGTRETPKYCAVVRDLTQWKQAETELTEARRDAETASSQKSEFLAKISHEIRTPLNAIIGFAEVMMEERFGPIGNERYKEYAADIRTSGEHMMSLVNDLLDLSKIESGRMELNFTSVQTNDIVEQCVAIMQAQANRDRIILRTSLAHGLPAVVADARSLRQILLNLLSNAVKFTRPGGQVIVSTVFDKEGEVLLRVRDTGVGMSEHDIATALEPFRQVGSPDDQGDQAGSGLGLPLTKALAEANRAQFTIESKIDQGTMVQVAFPSTRVLAE